MKYALVWNKDAFFALIPRINVALIACAVCLGAYLFYSLARPHEYGSLNKRWAQSRAGSSRSWQEAEARPVFAEGTFKAKYLFTTVKKKTGEQDRKDFQLLGISVGTKNLAMIRDVRNNKDYYCVVGDMVGIYRVKEIFRDKVLLESSEGTLEINR